MSCTKCNGVSCQNQQQPYDVDDIVDDDDDVSEENI